MFKPRPPVQVTDELRNRFARFVRKDDNGCWEWSGGRDKKGYGRFRVKYAYWRAHRVAYELATGQWPGSALICHSCDNPSCVNPAHLWLGTNRENMQDAGRKSRLGRCRGESHPHARLTPALVRAIRRSPLGPRAMGRRLGVSHYTIYSVRAGLTWSHVQ